MKLETKTLYGVLEALDGIFSPDSTKFSDYVKETSDDNSFLRTAFCKKKELLKDRENVTFRLYPNLNHAFVNSVYGSISKAKKEYNIEQHIGEDVTGDIASWIKAVTE